MDVDIANLIQDLKDSSAHVRCEAAGALGALGGDGVDAIDPLVSVVCTDKDDFVRGEAMHSLWELACSCFGVVAEADRKFLAAIPTIQGLMQDPSDDVKASAKRLLDILSAPG